MTNERPNQRLYASRRYILAMGLEKVEQSRLKSRVCNKSDIKKKINLD